MNEEYNKASDNDEISKDEETADGFYDDSDFSFEEVEPQSVIIPDTVENKEGKAASGIKLFCAVLTVIFIASCCVFIGYYIGNNKKNQGISPDQPSYQKPSSEMLSTSDIYAKVAPSVVGILIYNEGEEAAMSEASGVVYTSDGYIITNDHIYSSIPSAQFKIFTSDGAFYSAKYIAGDTRSDLAVLKITDKVELKAAEFADSELVASGDYVCAIGCPNGHNSKSTITFGIVSVPKVRITNTTNYASNLIQTDSAINPGNSGGVLVNANGQVIGITSSKVAQTEYEGIGYAIPTKTVRKIIGSLMEFGKVTNRAKLGITYRFYNDVMAKLSGVAVAGLEIDQVLPECQVFGKLSKGDIITHADGVKLTSDAVLLDMLEDSAPGDNLVLTVYRSYGTTDSITVKLIGDSGSSSYKVK